MAQELNIATAMSPEEKAQVSTLTIETEILSYLVDHPSANDTLEGITEWWLLEQRVKTGLTTVKSALQHLRSMAFVVEESKPSGRLAYRINQEKLSEIKAWLRSQTEQ